MIYQLNDVNKILDNIPEFIKKSFENDNGTLKLYDLLTWYYSQSMQTKNFFGE